MNLGLDDSKKEAIFLEILQELIDDMGASQTDSMMKKGKPAMMEVEVEKTVKPLDESEIDGDALAQELESKEVSMGDSEKVGDEEEDEDEDEDDDSY